MYNYMWQTQASINSRGFEFWSEFGFAQEILHGINTKCSDLSKTGN